MNNWRVITGAAIGVGAIAIAPFTGGGSVLGATTLLGSLSGARTIATALTAGSVGAYVGAHTEMSNALLFRARARAAAKLGCHLKSVKNS